jgi:hypothetical protein
MENIRTIRQIRRRAQPIARCGAGSAKPVKKRTPRNHRNGFLNHSFQPFWMFNGNKARAENEFFRSLENICAYYDLLLPDVTGLSFPQNIYRSWEVTAARIKAIDNQLDCIIIKDELHVGTLGTIRRYDTDMTLYYIPCKPLWNWVQQSQQQDIAELVMVIFAYLNQVVQIPFYTEQYSFLKGQYEYIDEMINQDMVDEEEEMEYRQQQLDELYILQSAGMHLYREIIKPHWLEQMETIALKYSHAEKRDNDWALLAIEFVQLYQNYPNRSFFDNIHPELFNPEIMERISADQYISFYWSANDSLNDTLFDMINCSFQEIGVTDEPTAVELFDTLTGKKSENFGFETRLFPLINRLCELLSNYDDDEH